jgi:ubiquinone/menaquinone biosynthesis C-methylase UbiE
MGKFPESKFAHKYLDGLRGIEIGAGAHNPYGILYSLNVDYTDEMTTFKKAEVKNCGEFARVNILANGDDLPFKDNTLDYVLSSHVIEHFVDPINTLNEWMRVLKPGGLIFLCVPHSKRVRDEKRPDTTIEEFKERHRGLIKIKDISMENGHDDHLAVWSTQSFLAMCREFNFNVVDYLDVDDKVGNGFMVVIKKDGILKKHPIHRDNDIRDYKLNLGCGINKKDGFINLDRTDGWWFEDGLNYADGSCKAITISHALMYVEEKNYNMVFREFFRVLEEGGVIRITEDDTENKDSERFMKPYEGAKSSTGPLMMRKYLEEAGFYVYDTTADRSAFVDNSLLQSLHGIPPKVFYIEGVK